MASNYQYTNVPGKLKDFMVRIHRREFGVPDKATYNWLESIGYKSKNDRGIVRVLKFINFASSDGTPTEYWQQYSGTKHKRILANAIKEGYSELFKVYPQAQNASDNDLEGFFSTRTSSGRQVISYMVSTFKALCELADFDQSAGPPAKAKQIVETPSLQAGDSNSHPSQALQVTPSLHIDIQIHISADSSPKQIDQIFESMAKHLYKRDHAEE